MSPRVTHEPNEKSKFQCVTLIVAVFTSCALEGIIKFIYFYRRDKDPTLPITITHYLDHKHLNYIASEVLFLYRSTASAMTLFGTS